MIAKLSTFVQEGEDVMSRIDYPIFRAMAAGVTELEVTVEEFAMCMRFAVMSNVYYQENGIPTILTMKLKII